MARTKNILLKGASGKIGDIVTFEREGTQVIREYVIPKDPKSPAQLAQRMKLKLANKGLSPLKFIIRRGHIGNSKAYRSSISKTMKNCIAGDYPNMTLDYSKVKLAEGKLQLPENISTQFDNKTNTIYFSWNSSLTFSDQPGRSDDKVNIISLNEKLLVANQISNTPIRSDGKASLKLPNNWEIADTHIWIYLTSYDLLQNSDSMYLKKK